MRKIDCTELYDDGQLYDLLVQNLDNNDLQFYREIIKRYGQPVLELAAGTGRLTIPLAIDGVDITGIDISKSMLEEARKKALKLGLPVNFVQADIRNFRFDDSKKFQTIFIPINSICHLHTLEDFELFFRSIRNHITPNGHLIIDIFVPDLKILSRPETKNYPVATFNLHSGEKIVVTEQNFYEPIQQINHIKWIYKNVSSGKTRVVQNNMRILFPKELENLLIYNGFFIEERFGDYGFHPLDKTSSKNIICCKIASN